MLENIDTLRDFLEMWHFSTCSKYCTRTSSGARLSFGFVRFCFCFLIRGILIVMAPPNKKSKRSDDDSEAVMSDVESSNADDYSPNKKKRPNKVDNRKCIRNENLAASPKANASIKSTADKTNKKSANNPGSSSQDATDRGLSYDFEYSFQI